MQKLFQILQYFFYTLAFAFFITQLFIVTSSSDGVFPRDLLGFEIPQPPLWTSYIPILGGIIGYAFELFSLHGLTTIILAGTLFKVGQYCGDKSKGFGSIERSNLEKMSPNIPLVIQAEVLSRQLSKKDFPVLYKWNKEHPETFKQRWINLAEKHYDSDLIYAAQMLESDLEHGG